MREPFDLNAALCGEPVVLVSEDAGTCSATNFIQLGKSIKFDTDYKGGNTLYTSAEGLVWHVGNLYMERTVSKNKPFNLEAVLSGDELIVGSQRFVYDHIGSFDGRPHLVCRQVPESASRLPLYVSVTGEVTSVGMNATMAPKKVKRTVFVNIVERDVYPRLTATVYSSEVDANSLGEQGQVATAVPVEIEVEE